MKYLMAIDAGTGSVRAVIFDTIIQEALKSANLKGSDIVAVSATSMREGIILYDKEGEALWGVANVDARADKEVRFLKEQYEGNLKFTQR